jgi:membrane-associated phospholipid phosphatase
MAHHSGYIWSRLIHIRGARSLAFLLMSGAIFAGIAVSIKLPGLTALDLQVTRDIQHIRNGIWDALMFAATFMGNSLTLVLVAAAGAAFLYFRGHPRAAGLVALSLLSLPIDELLKLWMVRPRPDAESVEILLSRTGTSFPSGHAMGSTVVYGLMAAMIWMRGGSGFWRVFLTWGLASLPLIVSLSRIYVGAHWLSDVVAGMSAGAFLLVPLVGLYKHWHRVTPTNQADS